MTLSQMNLASSRENLVKAAERLPINELGNLVQDLLSLQARRHAPILSPGEADLLQQINQGLSPERQARYEELIEKRLDETLTVAEHQELLQLNQLVEQLNVTRMKSLVLLAQVRQSTVRQLMTELGIEPQYVA